MKGLPPIYGALALSNRPKGFTPKEKHGSGAFNSKVNVEEIACRRQLIFIRPSNNEVQRPNSSNKVHNRRWINAWEWDPCIRRLDPLTSPYDFVVGSYKVPEQMQLYQSIDNLPIQAPIVLPPASSVVEETCSGGGKISGGILHVPDIATSSYDQIVRMLATLPAPLISMVMNGSKKRRARSKSFFRFEHR